MICSNCGADIGDNETACPYCGAMQYENSEQKYMKDLYNLNEGMEKLDKNTRKYIIKSTMKSVGIVYENNSCHNYNQSRNEEAYKYISSTFHNIRLYSISAFL